MSAGNVSRLCSSCPCSMCSSVCPVWLGQLTRGICDLCHCFTTEQMNCTHCENIYCSACFVQCRLHSIIHLQNAGFIANVYHKLEDSDEKRLVVFSKEMGVPPESISVDQHFSCCITIETKSGRVVATLYFRKNIRSEHIVNVFVSPTHRKRHVTVENLPLSFWLFMLFDTYHACTVKRGSSESKIRLYTETLKVDMQLYQPLGFYIHNHRPHNSGNCHVMERRSVPRVSPRNWLYHYGHNLQPPPQAPPQASSKDIRMPLMALLGST